MKKIGRNDPCHCGSGKKFKKCCESKMIGGRYVATKIDAYAAPQLIRNTGLTGLFNRQISVIAKPSTDVKPIQVKSVSISAESTRQEAPVLMNAVTEKIE